MEEIQRLDMKILELSQQAVKKHEIKMSAEDRDAWEWSLFEHRYARDHGVYSKENALGDRISNVARRIIYNSSFIFGLPIMLFFIFLFSGIYSDEKQHGTMEFLYTQPINKLRIALAKMGAMLCVAVFYIVLSGTALLIVFRIQGLPLDGFGEIYRVFDPENPLRYVVASDLIVEIIFGYLVMVIFFSAFIFLFSARFQDTSAVMMYMLIFIVITWALTKNVSFFQRPWNPMYALDYMQTITGKVVSEIDAFGKQHYRIIYSGGTQQYLNFILMSIIWTGISLKIEKNTSQLTVKRRKFGQIHSLAGFEYRKRSVRKDFAVVLGCCVILLCLYLPMQRKDGDAVDVMLGDSLFRFYENNVKESREFLEKETKRRYVELSGDSRDKNEDVYLKVLRDHLDTQESVLEGHQRMVRGFLEKDGKDFYEMMIRQTKQTFGKTKGYVGFGESAYDIFVRGQPMSASYHESCAIFQKASEENVTPIFGKGAFFSDYEEFSNSLLRHEWADKLGLKSHSAFYLIYRLFRAYFIDIAFLTLVSLLVLGGYVFDKEHGNQLEFMYTEPVRRSRYHWTKIGISVVVSAGLFLLFFAFVFMLGGVSEGVGAWNFPVVEYLSLLSDPFQASEQEVLESISLIPLWQYLLRVCLVLVAECFFLSSLSTFLSIFTKKKNQLLAGLALLVGGGVFLSNYLPQGILRLLSPFQYLQASTVANGSVKIFRNLPKENFWQSVLILVVWGIILGVVGARVVKKRECV